MWSSTTRNLVAIAFLGACTGNPDVVIDVTTGPGVVVEVYSCATGDPVGDGTCHHHMMSPNEHTVGIFTDQPRATVAWQITSGENYCQQVELDLSHGTIDLDYTAAATKEAAMVTRCDPGAACMPLTDCK